MTINLPTKKEQILKKLLNVEDLKPIIEKVILDWIDYTISTKYKSRKTDDEILNELNS